MKWSINTRRVGAIFRREFNEIIRDPLYMAMAILVPPFIMLIFGFGLKLDVEHLPLGISDMDQSRLSREYIDSFVQSPSFELKKTYTDERAMSEDLRTSKLRTALVIPADFEKQIVSGRSTTVQILIDGTIPVRAEIARGYAAGAHAQFLTRLPEYVKWFGAREQTQARVNVVSRIEYNPSLRSDNFVIPGLIATTLMFYPALLTTLSIVREKESQSILALYCSPVSRSELLLGKLMPYLLISAINFTSTFLLGLFLFKVPFIGSWTLLIVATVVYIFSTCALGLMISVLVHKQVAAILVTMALTILPSFLYSGFFTPLAASTWSMWIMGRFVLATYYLDILRGLFLKGTGWDTHWPALLMMVLFSAILYTVAFKTFRKRLD
jgi:ABC-2 type transport system permease protein